ncbi:MAG: hypothetical protein IPG59_12665 [Candidatus Melainabacteria bacterium]|nr:MAG: hypothetical protein IPG59_12665 [Candidatus Melainabacteria bacterium]
MTQVISLVIVEISDTVKLNSHGRCLMTALKHTTDQAATVNTLTASFKRSTRDKTTVFTYVMGRVAFLEDRKLWGIHSGDLWELQVRSSNPAGTVYFVRPIKIIAAAQDGDVLNGLDYEAVRDSRLALSHLRTWKKLLSSDQFLNGNMNLCLHHLKLLSSYLRNNSLSSKLKVNLSKTIMHSLSQLKITQEPVSLELLWESLETIASCTSSNPDRIHSLRRLIKLYDSGFNQHAKLSSDTKVRLLLDLQNALQPKAGKRDAL